MSSFVGAFNSLPLDAFHQISLQADTEDAKAALLKESLELEDFARLISPAAGEFLEPMGRRSHRLTLQRFGRVMRLFAPLYLSNECVNNCRYCGFSRDNPILRVTLSMEEVREEAQALKAQGFRNILLVAGEHPKFVSSGYLEDCLRTLHPDVPALSLEVGPMETEEYRPMVAAGAEGLVVYQETYNREVYRQMHTAGPKKDFDWRLETPERGYRAGFRRLGIGALLGLSDWRREALCLAAHARYLLRTCWKAQVTISLPRLRPCAGEFQPLTRVTDRQLVQLVAAFRIFLPDVGIVLSTRESPALRNGLVPLGITMMSAGSHTEPGGYTGAGKKHVHRKQRGRIQPPEESEAEPIFSQNRFTSATGQFDIADERSPREIAELLQGMGYEPVWKDWETALVTA